MLFNIGIERPLNGGGAFGIIVPAFDALGYNCFSTADTMDEIATNAKDAILTMAEEVVNDGFTLEKLDLKFKSFAEAYPDFNDWFVLEVPIEHLSSKPKRINITLPELLISRIDEHVSQNAVYSDRSDFLAKVSKEKLTGIKLKSSLGFVKYELPSIVRRDYLDPLASFVCHFYTEGKEEFETSLYDYLFSDNVDSKHQLDTIVQAIKEAGTTEILKEAYDAIQEEVDEHDREGKQVRMSRKFATNPLGNFNITTTKEPLKANIVVGWKKGGIGKTTIVNLLNHSGFKAVEQDANKDYVKGFNYRILPICSLHDLDRLTRKQSDGQSELDNIKTLDPKCHALIVINNCAVGVASNIATKLSELALEHVALLLERNFLSSCGDAATVESLGVALKDEFTAHFVELLRSAMFELSPVGKFQR